MPNQVKQPSSRERRAAYERDLDRSVMGLRNKWKTLFKAYKVALQQAVKSYNNTEAALARKHGITKGRHIANINENHGFARPSGSTAWLRQTLFLLR